jgi:Protein of unknown function (DUF2726)
MYDQWTWVFAAVSVALLGGAVWMRFGRGTDQEGKPLPSQWTLTARPVFTVEERRVYRQLREALPHHVVLAKLPLVRFCQPTDPEQVRYWYEMLGANHVSFAVCSANGRVLAAIDLEQDRQSSRRSLKIKQQMLAACKVRYLRCAPHEVPSLAELQLLVPTTGIGARAPQPVPARAPQGADGLQNGAARRRERPTLWQDSNFLQDSFFGDDGGGRVDADAASTFGQRGQRDFTPSRSGMAAHVTPKAPLDGGGVVSDTTGASWLRH